MVLLKQTRKGPFWIFWGFSNSVWVAKIQSMISFNYVFYPKKGSLSCSMVAQKSMFSSVSWSKVGTKHCCLGKLIDENEFMLWVLETCNVYTYFNLLLGNIDWIRMKVSCKSFEQKTQRKEIESCWKKESQSFMFIGGSDIFCGFAKYHNSIWPH